MTLNVISVEKAAYLHHFQVFLQDVVHIAPYAHRPDVLPQLLREEVCHPQTDFRAPLLLPAHASSTLSIALHTPTMSSLPGFHSASLQSFL
jgi:hypothetical protein